MKSEKITILHVEDNPIDQRLLKLLLQEYEGEYHLEVCATLSEALEFADAKSFDIILLDTGLSDSNGLDTFIRVHARCPMVPIIVLSGDSDSNRIQNIIRAGAQEYLVKGSFDGQLLSRTIRYAIERNKMVASLKRSTQELKTSRAQLRHIIDRSADAIIIVDKQGICRFINPAGELIYQAESVDLIGRNLGLPLEPGTTLEQCIHGARGKEVVVEIRSERIEWEGAIGFLASLRDITERKRGAMELAASERRLFQFIDQVPIGVYVLDRKGNVYYTNSRAIDILGSKLVGKQNIEQMIEDCEIFGVDSNEPYPVDQLPTLLAMQGELIRDALMDIVTPAGRKTIEMNTGPILDGGGKVKFVIAAFRDVSERRKSESQLRKLYRAVEQSPVSVVITDREGYIEYVNPKFCDITGYSPVEVKGKKPDILRTEFYDPDFFREMWKTILSGHNWTGEFCNKKKDGTLFWEKAHISPVFDADHRITNFIAVKEDISGRKELEHQLQQAQKMESVGRLAGGVAHDFNNHLSVILGFCELALEEIQSSGSLRSSLEEIQKAGQKAAGITSHLLAFSRKQVLLPKNIDLNKSVADLQKMLGHLLGEDVRIITMLQEKPWIVKVDPGQLQQALVNLCINARDAMPTMGEIVIEIKNVRVSAENADEYSNLAEGDYMKVAVSDTGHGMDSETMDKVFEPFFTTKREGKGTGLGLAMVHGFVSQSGGIIKAYSQPGTGTTFEIFFPADAGIEVEQDVTSAKETVATGTETVLLVEDEEGVRKFIAMALEKCGYRLLIASGSYHALEICEDFSQKIDLLLTDIVMPEMGGVELSRLCLEMRPEIKVMYMSGYPAGKIEKLGSEGRGHAFLQKPITSSMLGQKTREVLDAPL